MKAIATCLTLAAMSVLLGNPASDAWAEEDHAVQQAGFGNGLTGYSFAADQSTMAVRMLDEPAVADDPGYSGDESAPRRSPFVEEDRYCDASCDAYCDGAGYGGCSEPCCQPQCYRATCRRRRVDEPIRFLTPRALACRDITLGGWIQQGVSVVANSPADRYNGVVTFNDRDGEYQMNQTYFFLERNVDTRGCGWDFGGRIDFLYGTDARFVQAVDGLEANWGQNEPFYQAALPQFYLDVAYNNWTVRMGHFYSILGYEHVQAPENFFYSHSYAKQYGEPFTHTGMLVMYDVTDSLTLSGGFHRGWDQFDDTDGLDRLSFLGGINWVSCDSRKAVAFAITSGEQGPGNDTVMYSIVGGLKLTDRLSYVIQHDYGQSTGGFVDQRTRVAEWYGINQYIAYDLTRQWSVGARIEWFRDRDGVRVRGLGQGNVAGGAFQGDFYEIALGLNWNPHRNLVVRPEVRWDWFEADDVSPNGFPYDANQSANQFMFGCDVIVSF
jgi:hypothetical protein